METKDKRPDTFLRKNLLKKFGLLSRTRGNEFSEKHG